MQVASDREVSHAPEGAGRAGALGAEARLRDFDPVGLEDIGAVSLLNRRDTKYLLSELQLWQLLEMAQQQGYRVLEVDGRRLHAYHTTYFDTADLRLYRAHHAGRPKRTKVRTRMYRDTQLAYFEVKTRTGDGQTRKERLATTAPRECPGPGVLHWLNERLAFDAGLLEPQLVTVFHRVTLVSAGINERVTVDVGLAIADSRRKTSYPGLAIAEVKEPRGARGSAFTAAARDLGIRPTSFSKFCVGIATLRDDVKHNTFKPVLREAARAMKEAAG